MTGWYPPRRAGDVVVARWVRIDGPPTTGNGDDDALLLPPPPPPPPPFYASGTVVASAATATTTTSTARPDRPPTNEEVETLRRAFASFYGPPTERDPPEAYELMSECIDAWVGSHQGGDEIAGLYRVRGDMDMVSQVLMVT
jgi:hypothetical protein